MGRKQLLVRLRVKSSEGSAQRASGGASFPDEHLDFDIGEVARSLGFDPGLSELGGNSKSWSSPLMTQMRKLRPREDRAGSTANLPDFQPITLSLTTLISSAFHPHL